MIEENKIKRYEPANEQTRVSERERDEKEKCIFNLRRQIFAKMSRLDKRFFCITHFSLIFFCVALSFSLTHSMCVAILPYTMYSLSLSHSVCVDILYES